MEPTLSLNQRRRLNSKQRTRSLLMAFSNLLLNWALLPPLIPQCVLRRTLRDGIQRFVPLALVDSLDRIPIWIEDICGVVTVPNSFRLVFGVVLSNCTSRNPLNSFRGRSPCPSTAPEGPIIPVVLKRARTESSSAWAADWTKTVIQFDPSMYSGWPGTRLGRGMGYPATSEVADIASTSTGGAE